jgi:hypothetical protein
MESIVNRIATLEARVNCIREEIQELKTNLGVAEVNTTRNVRQRRSILRLRLRTM